MIPFTSNTFLIDLDLDNPESFLMGLKPAQRAAIKSLHCFVTPGWLMKPKARAISTKAVRALSGLCKLQVQLRVQNMDVARTDVVGIAKSWMEDFRVLASGKLRVAHVCITDDDWEPSQQLLAAKTVLREPAEELEKYLRRTRLEIQEEEQREERERAAEVQRRHSKREARGLRALK